MRRTSLALAALLVIAAAEVRADPPLPPALCAASDSLCGRVRINWEGPAGGETVDFFEVYRNGEPIGTAAPSATSLLDTTAAPNVFHDYAVRAWNADGASALCEDSGRGLTAPAPPASFAASRDLCGRVRLAWQPPAGDAPVWGYRILGDALPGGKVDLPPDSLGYTDASGVDDVVYAIRSFNCEESAGVLDTGRLLSAVPPAPAACAAAFVSCGAIRVSWSRVEEALSGYMVFRDEGVFVDSVGPADTSLVAAGLSGGTDHVFRVFSRNDCGRAAAPCSVTARMPGPVGPPPAQACSASRDSCAGVYVAWTWSSPDMEWYRVVRVEDGVLLDSVGPETRTFFDGSVAEGDTVHYAIQAGNRCYVASEACTTLGARPALPSTPELCSGSEDRCGEIRLSWIWPSRYIHENIHGFRIYRTRQDQPSSPPEVFTVPPHLDTVTWDDTAVEPLVTYRYRVFAYSRCGEGAGYCQGTGSAATVPAVGSLLSPPDGASGLELPIALSWQSRLRATSYRLEVAADAAFVETFLDTTLTGNAFSLTRVDTFGVFHWRVRAENACGDGSLYPARTFEIPSIPGLAIASGGTSFAFGNGADTLFSDSTFVLENRWFNTVAWVVDDTLPWIEFFPPTGLLAPAGSETVTVSVDAYRCGIDYAESLAIDMNPVPPGQAPLRLRASLRPPPRPRGDVDWDCRARTDDAVRILESLLGSFFSTDAESAGADANGDGRINVADVVFLAGDLLAKSPSGPEKKGDLDLTLGGEGGEELSVSTDFPIRAVRFLFAVPGEEAPALAAADPERSVLVTKSPGGSGGLFWFSDEAGGKKKAPLLRIGGAAGTSPLEAEWIEILGVSGETIRMSLNGRAVLPPLSAGPVLHEIRPSPFNALAVVRYTLPERSHVRLAVYDVRGALVRVLADGVRGAGVQEARWEGETEGGRAAPSGVYFVRLETASGERTDSMIRRALLIR